MRRLTRALGKPGGRLTERVSARTCSLAALMLSCTSPTPRHDPALDTRRIVEIDELTDEVDPALEPPSPIADQPAAPIDSTLPLEEIAPAAAEDTAFDSDETVEALRFVYRVRLDVPGTVGPDSRGETSDVVTPAAELFVDVSADRLRARFVGPAWPIEAGSEVRLRADSPGAYVFDRDGGRPLVPGALAGWFEGGTPRAGPMLAIRRDPLLRGTADPGPGTLLCALLAEWAGDPRDVVSRRCATGAPLTFRVGFWRGERTAEVPIQLPRRELRADHHDPVRGIPRGSSRAFLEPSALARLPSRALRESDLLPEDAEANAIDDGLELENQSDTRVVVIVGGVAIGWVDAHATGRFLGLRPGVHAIAAMRALGAVVMRPRDVMVPGRTVLRAVRRREE